MSSHRPRVNPPGPRPPRSASKITAVAPLHQKAKKIIKRSCPNKECDKPDVQDGTCHNCGTIVDDSNIVSEIQFGESGSGAAVAQGTYVSAESGTGSSMGPAFNRVGRGGSQVNSIREAKVQMDNWRHQLKIPESVATRGHQLYKLASHNNFVQGRRIDQVAAVCLYTAHRQHADGCNTMLIDFADILGVNVFRLGQTFKNLHKEITAARDGIRPVIPEELMYRFADKLEFGNMKDKVASDAIRLCQRMSKDWLSVGRRPSGICGAALVIAARMNNFRRSITEVVYIVKITTHTIQKRIDEFQVTPSSALSIDDFLRNEFLEQAHDPPSFYRAQPGYVKPKKNKKRKRTADDEGDPNEPTSTETTATDIRVDKDGFAVPAPPNSNIDPNILRAVDGAVTDADDVVHMNSVYQAFGDRNTIRQNEASLADNLEPTDKPLDRRFRSVFVPSEWAKDEETLNEEITQMVSDPKSTEHANAYARATKWSKYKMDWINECNPQATISDDTLIGEDEFANDPEVMNCQLGPAEVALKEALWVNENKSWLRHQQAKAFEKKKAGPKKDKQPRVKRTKMGEDVAVGTSAEDAAAKSMAKRQYSKKINPAVLTNGLFSIDRLPGGKFLGSRSASAAPPSTAGSNDEDEESRASTPAVGDTSEAGSPPPAAKAVREMSAESIADDYVDPDADEDTYVGNEDDEYEPAHGFGNEEEPDEFDEIAAYHNPTGADDDDDNW